MVKTVNGIRTFRWSRLVRLAVMAMLLVPATAQAIDPAKAPLPVDTARLTEPAFLERLKRIEQTLRKNGAPPLFNSQPEIIPLTDSPTLFTTNAYGADGIPYVGMIVHLYNRSGHVQELDPATVSLTADGKTVRFSDVPASIHGFVVDVAGRNVSVEEAIPRMSIALAPKKVTSVMMLFAPVESRGKVPAMTLRLEPGGKPIELDLNRLHGALLEAEIVRIGPQGACAVVTVQGAIDGINAGELAQRLKEVNAAGVTRYVVSFGPRAAAPSSTILGWLDSMAVFGEIGDQYRGLPSLPTEVSELHFAGIPVSVARETREESRARDHQEIEAAIAESLWAPYRGATRQTVLNELEKGDPRGRAAALLCGAHAYIDADLPKLAKWIDDPSRAVRQGACNAIARVNSDAARQVLETAVREGSPRSAETALPAMMNARSALMVAAGIKAAQGATKMSETALLRILIDARHPAFAERIRAAAKSGSKEARLLALPALGADRSSETVRIFEEAFASGDREIRDGALAAASARLQQGDQRLRKIVIEEALRRLRSNPSDPAAFEIATRTRDPRFVPLLASRLSSGSTSVPERAAVVERLAQIGGAAAMEVLVRQFDELTPAEQNVVLAQLWREDPDRALPFAERLISSTDSDLGERCRQILVHDGSDRSVEAICQAIRTGNLPHRENLLFALATIATPSAYDGLCEFRDAGNVPLREQTEVAFVMYWQRSPALEAAETATMSMDREIPAARADVNEALKLLNAAREIDPLLPQVYRGRGNAYLRLGQWRQAASDFEAAMELNPYDEISLTGSAIAWVMLGRDEQALGWLTAAKSHFENSSNYSYNSACAYSRSLEQQLKQPASTKRDELVKQYRDAAFDQLNQAVNLGFGARDEELPLLEKDPDLLALHDDPRFAEVVVKVKQSR
jgi:tetratricopeptide (TPR) repeat protein